MHNIRSRAAAWVAGSIPLPSEFADFSRKAKSAINGVLGSTHAPTSLILINGSGVVVTGPLVVLAEGSLQTGLGGRFQHEDADFPQLDVGHAGRAKRVLTSGLKALGFPLWTARARLDFAGMQLHALAVVNPDLSITPGRMTTVLDVVDGAGFTAVSVNFRVGVVHPSAPTAMPRARVLRIDRDGVALALTRFAPGADADGYVSVAAPTSGTAWYAAGAGQSLVIPIDAGTTIDTSLYEYRLDFLDEQGPASAPWQVPVKAPVDDVFTTNNPLTGWGGTTRRTLCVGQTNPAENGIYDSAFGAWTRVKDCAEATDFAPGFLVTMKEQAPPMNGAVWQYVTPTDPVVVGTTEIYFGLYGAAPVAALVGAVAPSIPSCGTILTSVACDFAPTEVRY